ncbi:MAG: hypothetical protein DCC67_21130, partial [Planctomycetota bacterium]
DGAIVVVGHTTGNNSSNERALALRLTPAGGFDAGFGSGGITIVDLVNAGMIVERLRDVAIGSDGKIIAGGMFRGAVTSVPDFLLMQFESGLLAADAGGPYALDEPGGTVQLIGSAQGAGTLAYEWDLDGDNVFGETGPSAAFGDENLQNPAFTVAGADGPTDYTVRLRVTSVIDQFTPPQTAIDSATVTVANVDPALTVGSQQVAVDEGDPAVNLGTYFDAGGDPVALIASVGTVVNNNDGTWSWSYAPGDGPDQSQTVTITADDGEGGVASVTFDLIVANVAPSVAADSPAVTADEGDTAVNSGVYSDVGADSVSIAASVGTVVANPNGTWTWSYGVPDDFVALPVIITATDSDGAVQTTQFTVTGINKNPAVSAGAAAIAVDEGAEAANSGSFGDVPADAVTVSASLGTVTQDAFGNWFWSYTPADGAASSTVTITATDEDGGLAQTTFTLDVANVNPSATLSAGGPVDEGSSATVSFSGQSDPSAADAAAGFRYALDFGNDGIWDVGDGTYAGSASVAAQSVPATYLADGGASVAVKGRIIDKDGGWQDYTTTIDVLNVAPTISNLSL